MTFVFEHDDSMTGDPVITLERVTMTSDTSAFLAEEIVNEVLIHHHGKVMVNGSIAFKALVMLELKKFGREHDYVKQGKPTVH